MHSKLVNFIREIYQTNEFVPLHVPTFSGSEKAYVLDTIESTFVSSVGAYVDRFERDMEAYTGSKKAIAVVNGTSALHAALYMSGVQAGDLVITQALTFVATCNAIFHLGASPLFIDVSRKSLGLCPKKLEEYLEQNAVIDSRSLCVHKTTGQVIRAIVPMHTFGHPVELDELKSLCDTWQLTLIEDAAESLGSYYKGKHTGTLGQYGVLSFNGNKVITTGGGGMILCENLELGNDMKHITTTAKVSHPYEFFHDKAAFNYRMPNINAALGCAQLESLTDFLLKKRQLAHQYKDFFAGSDYQFVVEPEYAQSNYWLNAVICPNAESRNMLLEYTNKNSVMTRPVWQLMHKLPMYQSALHGPLDVSEWFEKHLVNIPSTPISI